jgi:uncharacterized protein (DUF58 family)
MSAAAAAFAFDPAEVAQIELHLLRWMREYTSGEHASLTAGTGFNLAGLKEWEPGDPVSSVDWAQSSLTNFSPMITRQFEQDSSATIVALVDESASTRCGTHGVSMQTAVCRCLAAVGLAAAFFQDSFGFIGFDAEFRAGASARPRLGKAHVQHCVERYQARARPEAERPVDVLTMIPGFVRRTGMLVVVSDFLLHASEAVLAKLGRLSATHDLLLLMVDAGFAYELPRTSAGWIEVFDVESGDVRVLSRRELGELARRVGEWQQAFAARAHARGLDVVRVGLDRWQIESALAQWVVERRVRKVRL